MRQFMWKTALFDTEHFLDYKKNLNGPDAIMYMASRDEPLILHEITRIIAEDDWTGNLNKIVSEKSQNVQLLKQIIIYAQKVLGTVSILPESMFYQLVPLLYVFRSYQLEYRGQYIASMY